MPNIFEKLINKTTAVSLIRLSLFGSLMLLSGCATMGSKMALDIAKEEEAKGCQASYPGEGAKVALEDCERVSRLIKKAGVPEGFVGYDKSGRIKLKGSYLNEGQVDLAYMVALTVVGVSSLDISPVTPREIQEIKMVKSYTPQVDTGKKGDKYALLIGISTFQNKFGEIGSAVNDARSLSQILEKNGFKKNNINVLTNELATKNNILNAIHELEAKAMPNDSVLFYMSTHGSPPDTIGKMGVVPYDMKKPSYILSLFGQYKKANNEELSESLFQTEMVDKISKSESGDDEIIKIVRDRVEALKTAIAFDDLQSFFTNIQSDNFVAILDTCYSGAALGALTYPVGGNQYIEREKNYSQSLSSDNKTELLGDGQLCEIDQKSSYGNATVFGIHSQRPAGLQQFTNNGSSKSLTLNRPNENTSVNASLRTASLAKEREVNEKKYQYESFENLRKAFGLSHQQGKAILTATSNNEQSLFNPEFFDNSYFTYYLVEGLKHSHGELFPAFDYAQIRTRKLVSETESSRTQTPEMVSIPAACANIDLSR
ncbi:MAG: caspase family protein [Methylococcaceae bacterium]|nr:MAG: caspase family protein [Methylococcaceae bacterium]